MSAPSIRPVSPVCRGIAFAALLFSVLAPLALAQAPAKPDRFEITDNSFLVEEALNQEAGVAQHILAALRSQGRGNDPDSWDFSFTQEWPLGGPRHQFSYVLSYTSVDRQVAGWGDLYLNYRLQIASEDINGVAIAPRLSLILPTGSESKGLGEGSPGLELNLPVSRQVNDYYLHFNAGGAWFPGSESGLQAYHVSGSAIWRAHQKLNLLTEMVTSMERVEHDPSRWEPSFTVVPGFRIALNVGSAQVVWGIGVPLSPSTADPPRGLFLYLSVEHPFR